MTVRRRRLLLVDDAPHVARVVARILAEAGHEVEVRGTGRAALERLAQGPPFDAALLDLGLPDVEAIDLIAEIRSRTPALPLLALSGCDAVEARRILDGQGIGFLAKPFAMDALIGRVGALLDAGPAHDLPAEALTSPSL